MIDGQRVSVVIPAAGRGLRMGGRQKQFLEILHRPILSYTLEAFERSSLIDSITVVTTSDAIPKVEALIRAERFSKIKHIITGGEHRQDSVWNGVLESKNENPDVFVIHDAARPFVSQEIISNAINAGLRYGAAIVAVSSNDTIKIADAENFVLSTPARDNCWIIQTPQVFRYRLLINAFQRAIADGFYGTDEASLVERSGVRVKIIEGSHDNIKITTPEDLEMAQVIANKRLNR